MLGDYVDTGYLDVEELARKLVRELETKGLLEYARAEGVKLLYARIKDEAGKTLGDSISGGETQGAPEVK